MERLFGTRIRAGVGLGQAIVLRTGGPPAPPPRQAAQLLRDPTGSTVDLVDVVLVGPDYAAAASMVLPWARVTAIVTAAGEARTVLAPVPAVTGVASVMESVADGSLLLVDADRAMVLVDPDAQAVAAFQAARRQIVPRRRLHLEYSHAEPRTLNGRRVRVAALAPTLLEAGRGADAGADALYVPAGAPLLADCAHPARSTGALGSLADAIGGKPVTLAAQPDAIDLPALLQAAVRLEAALALDLQAGPVAVEQQNALIQQCGEALLKADTEFGDVIAAGRVAPGARLPAPLVEYIIARVVVDGPGEPGGHGHAWLTNLCAEAGPILAPVEVVLGNPSRAQLEAALAAGASGLVVDAADVQAVKDLVRETDAGAVPHPPE